jgi:DNA repair protein RecO (recombination protein O)
MIVRYRSQCFVLKKKDLREADRSFIVFSKDFGKIEVVGKAIRKIDSKLRAGIEEFYLSEIEFIQGKNSKTLVDAIVIEKFKDIRQDLEKLEIAQKIGEAADGLIRGQEPDGSIWDLLIETFGNFQFSISNFPMAYYYFLFNLLAILGYQIDLYNCARCCRKLVPRKNYLLLQEGGIICSNCSDDSLKNKISILPETIKSLRFLSENSCELIKKLVISGKCLEDLYQISQVFLDYYKKQ